MKKIVLGSVLVLSTLLLWSCQSKPSASVSEEKDSANSGFATAYIVKSDKESAYYRINSGRTQKVPKDKSKMTITVRAKSTKQRLSVASDKTLKDSSTVTVPATKSLGKYSTIAEKVNGYIDESEHLSNLKHLSMDAHSGVTDVVTDSPINVRVNTDDDEALGFSVNGDLSTSEDPFVLSHSINGYTLWLMRATGASQGDLEKVSDALSHIPLNYEKDYKKTSTAGSITYTITVIPDVLVLVTFGHK